MEVTVQKLEEYAEEMLVKMGEYFESVDEFRKNFESNKKNITVKSIDFCIDKFVSSELDYQTAGNRGLGRASDYWPRLGGYFRGIVSKLDEDRLRKLDEIITKLILKCYLFSYLIADRVDKETDSMGGEQLYEKWIPQIYVFDLSNLGEDVGNMLFILIENDYNEIKEFFKQNGMKSELFGGDKTTEILNGYVGAGLVLRIADSGVM